MKAAVLKAFGSPLAIETVPDPVLGTGEVIVDVVATRVLSYANEVFSGERKYLLDLPVVPGPGAHRPGARDRTGRDASRRRRLGLSAIPPCVRATTCCRPTSRCRAGAPAAQAACGCKSISATVHGPSRCAFRPRTSNGSARSTRRTPRNGARSARCWCPMAVSSRRNCNPAKPCWSAAPPAISAAPPSRSRSPWARPASSRPAATKRFWPDLTRRFGDRVRTVKLSGNEDDDRERMKQAAPGPIDCVLDIMPPSVSTTTVRAALMTVRPYGRVVLMGGVGMLGGAGLELPYPWIMRNCIIDPRRVDVSAGSGHPSGRADPIRTVEAGRLRDRRPSISTMPTMPSRMPPPMAVPSR